MRNVQSFVFAKFMSDSAWYFLLFWLPKYLYDARGFDIKQVSYYAWIPYAASGVGSFIGGWVSSRLLRRRTLLNFARKLVLGLLRCGNAGRDAGFDRSGSGCAGALQHRLLLPAGMVGTDHDAADRHLSSHGGWYGRRPYRLWRRHRRSNLWPGCWLICWAMASRMRRCLSL